MIIQKTVILGGGKDGLQNVFVHETIISREFQRRSHPRVEGNILVLYCDFAPFNLGVPGSSLVVNMSFPRFFTWKICTFSIFCFCKTDLIRIVAASRIWLQNRNQRWQSKAMTGQVKSVTQVLALCVVWIKLQLTEKSAVWVSSLLDAAFLFCFCFVF